MSVHENGLREYDHLNVGGLPLKIDIDDLARQITTENYGFVRMLVALCRHQKEKIPHSDLASAVEKLILAGSRY